MLTTPRTSPFNRLLATTLTLSSALLVATSAPAAASSGSVGGGTVTLTADPGETLNVAVWFEATGFFDLVDYLAISHAEGFPIAFAGCNNAEWAQEEGDVACDNTPVATIRVDAGSASDYTSVSSWSTSSPVAIDVDASATTGGGTLEGYSPGTVTLRAGSGDYWIDLGHHDVSAASLSASSGAGKDVFTVKNGGQAAAVSVDAGTGSDSVSVAGSAANGAVRLGADDDTFSSTAIVPGGLRVSGDEGNDTFETMNGPVTLDGGAGNDLFEPDQNPVPPLSGGVPADPSGGDVIRGGPGRDTVELAGTGRVKPVRISLDGRANDGQAGERDNYHRDIEVVRVTNVPATLIGAPGSQTLELGRGGTAHGKGGNDVLIGAGKLIGGPGNDRLVGGTMMIGGPGRDVFVGSAETRTINARDGKRDHVRCSPRSATVVLADRSDIVNRRHCRKVVIG